MKIVVLRLGHRYVRDDRVTTHVFLVARAFGADKVIYSGQRDEKLEVRLDDITKMWGGSFEVEYEKDWKQTIVNWQEAQGEIVHLTAYGLPVQNVTLEIRQSKKDKLVIVGGAKVPRIVYALSDWNVSITSQPHSEISALGIFLHEFFEGKELSKIFQNPKLRIIPESRGKKIMKIEP